MTGLYLTWLADELRAARLTVVEYPGWTTRARSSGGFADGRPWCVMWHHTASSTSPQNDADYMCNGSPDRPIANLLIARDGAVWVLAAGATNTNGKGHAKWEFSRGQVPDDSMNTYAVGMEIANAGTGEQYPQAQIDSAFSTSIAIARRLGLAPTDCGLHEWYAPDRKIDPATTNVAGPWQPRAWNSTGTWDLDDLTAEHARRWAPTPTPTPEEDSVLSVFAMCEDQSGLFAVYTGGYKVWLYSADVADAARGLARLSGIDDTIHTYDETMFRALGPCLGPPPAGYDEWGVQK